MTHAHFHTQSPPDLPMIDSEWTHLGLALRDCDVTRAVTRAASIQKTAVEVISSFIVSDEFMENLKFSECMPKRMVQEWLRGRMLNQEYMQDTLGRNVALMADEISK